MSSFICKHCNKEIIDTKNGYITECEHYPRERKINKEILNKIEELLNEMSRLKDDAYIKEVVEIKQLLLNNKLYKYYTCFDCSTECSCYTDEPPDSCLYNKGYNKVKWEVD